MGYSVNGPIVRNGLVMNVDAGYDRSFNPRENLVAYSTYNVAAWPSATTNATITAGIDAPDGSNTAVRVAGTNAGNMLYRVSHPSITPSGTDSYVVSFYARLISGSSASNGISCDWGDLSPSGDYTSSLVTNTWVRVVLGPATSSAVARTFVDLISDTTTNYVIDFWGLQVEKSTTATAYAPTSGSTVTRGTNLTDIVSSTNFTSTANTPFNANNGGYFTFSGTSTSFLTNNTHASLNLTNNFSLESWVYVNSWVGGGGIITYGTDAGEQYALVTGTGGFFVFQYNWPGTFYGLFSSAQGAAGRWFHVVTTFSDGVMRMYINGIQTNTATATLTTITPVASSYLTIGNNHPGGDEMFNGRVAIARIYNRVLSPTEASQNFSAHRGRFGI